MSQVTASRTINAPAEAVWATLADYENIHLFHPGLDDSCLIGEQKNGLGATRRCDFKGGGSVYEEITDWVEGERYTVELSKIDMPLKSASATLSVSPIDDGSCTATMHMEYLPKYGILGALMDRMMIKKTMSGMFAKVLAELDRQITTE
jgi:ribosome-associated toxin RatA of RatAB toxin-antitoxin module